MIGSKRANFKLSPLLLCFSLAACQPPAPPAIDASKLGPWIVVDAGVYNPWTDQCSNKDAPVRRKTYVRQPAGDGPFPLFLFFIGTLRTSDNMSAKGIVERAAAEGFVAASVDYDTVATHLEKTPCEVMHAKSKCMFSDEEQESIVHLLCSNRSLDGSSLGLKVDCSKGIVAAGFSQGASIATLGRDHHPGVKAVWAIGMHNQSIIDETPMTCLNAGERKLPADRARVIVGEGDRVLKRPHHPRLQEVSGRTCQGDTCFAKNGSGWALLPNTQCAGKKCKHEYLDQATMWDAKNWWGAEHNIDWLKSFVK